MRSLLMLTPLFCLSGAIGVVELKEPVDMGEIIPMCVEQGVWLRPFGKLVYTMPPFISSNEVTLLLARFLPSIIANPRNTGCGKNYLRHA